MRVSNWGCEVALERQSPDLVGIDSQAARFEGRPDSHCCEPAADNSPHSLNFIFQDWFSNEGNIKARLILLLFRLSQIVSRQPLLNHPLIFSLIISIT
jgi:hypothetical protein